MYFAFGYFDETFIVRSVDLLLHELLIYVYQASIQFSPASTVINKTVSFQSFSSLEITLASFW